MAVQREIDYKIDYGNPEVTSGISVFSEAFDTAFAYHGDDLGAAYSKEHTEFRLWAPTASEAYTVLYDRWDSEPTCTLAMERGERGTWLLKADGDLHGKYYTYKVLVGEQWNEAVDPYARAVGVNGDKGYIADFGRADPEGWPGAKPPLESPLDMVIYELHVRDLSAHPESGIVNKGMYLGLTETGTQGPDGIKTGVDHIVDLGVTHVQLLPVYDYSTESVDETRPYEKYNWGYDPKNYNVPEGSYSSDPYDPLVRIRELKAAVKALHDRGLRVIMDVVYNHFYDGYRMNLAKLVPGYYLRYKPDGTLSDGSHCGNDVASERAMSRKYIVDSVLYWARSYGFDGFRFDLMGLLDVGTMLEIRRRLDELDPSIVTLGEGWDMETELPEAKRANQHHASSMPRIAHFNGYMRDAVKGGIFDPASRGFIGGDDGMAQDIRKGAAGGITYNNEIRLFADEPDQTVNYAECHDNYTMWDKLMLAAPWDSDDIRARMHRLGSAIVLTAQGIPFIHAGQEFMRTKYGVENSYISPDSINWMDWRRAADRKHDVWYMKELIALRKMHPAFRLHTARQIRDHLVFEPSPERTLSFTLRNHAGGDPAKHLYVLYSASEEQVDLELPELGDWQAVWGQSHIERLEGTALTIKGIAMIVLEISE
ncbi:pullulanase [Paenibacillus darwinianus]|uniref:Pullulanase n=1 Tax=Paenibacillus darwinianus TaxID=1380763 RepID=A0A9W5S1W7_9BACL|nr:type I pullulanase [Paenibacillus darwinianus]EXX90192.1 pullulanase [Paenibacillus darwinianus]EXX90857.1 pullulanase [Paenibacillus darwinianus]EXX90910.1 pullulanase [Paenibacillus darwinianus]